MGKNKRRNKNTGDLDRTMEAQEKKILYRRGLRLEYFTVGLNPLFGMWYSDSISGLIIVFFLFREGREVWAEASE